MSSINSEFRCRSLDAQFPPGDWKTFSNPNSESPGRHSSLSETQIAQKCWNKTYRLAIGKTSWPTTCCFLSQTYKASKSHNGLAVCSVLEMQLLANYWGVSVFLAIEIAKKMLRNWIGAEIPPHWYDSKVLSHFERQIHDTNMHK